MVEVKGEGDYMKIHYNLQSKFDTKLSCLESEGLKKLYEYQKQSCNYSDDGKSHDEELKVLEEQNEKTRHEIEAKLEEFSQRKTQYNNYKSDQKLLSEEIKDRHEAFLMVKKYFKTNLKIYYTIESRLKDCEIVLVQFFTEVKKDSDEFSVRLRRTLKPVAYELLELTPKLPSHAKEEVRTRLQRGDFPGAMCCLRRTFANMKKTKP